MHNNLKPSKMSARTKRSWVKTRTAKSLADVTVSSAWWEVAVWRRGLDGGTAFETIGADPAKGLISSDADEKN